MALQFTPGTTKPQRYDAGQFAHFHQAIAQAHQAKYENFGRGISAGLMALGEQKKKQAAEQKVIDQNAYLASLDSLGGDVQTMKPTPRGKLMGGQFGSFLDESPLKLEGKGISEAQEKYGAGDAGIPFSHEALDEMSKTGGTVGRQKFERWMDAEGIVDRDQRDARWNYLNQEVEGQYISQNKVNAAMAKGIELGIPAERLKAYMGNVLGDVAMGQVGTPHSLDADLKGAYDKQFPLPNPEDRHGVHSYLDPFRDDPVAYHQAIDEFVDLTYGSSGYTQDQLDAMKPSIRQILEGNQSHSAVQKQLDGLLTKATTSRNVTPRPPVAVGTTKNLNAPDLFGAGAKQINAQGVLEPGEWNTLRGYLGSVSGQAPITATRGEGGRIELSSEAVPAAELALMQKAVNASQNNVAAQAMFYEPGANIGADLKNWGAGGMPVGGAPTGQGMTFGGAPTGLGVMGQQPGQPGATTTGGVDLTNLFGVDSFGKGPTVVTTTPTGEETDEEEVVTDPGQKLIDVEFPDDGRLVQGAQGETTKEKVKRGDRVDPDWSITDKAGGAIEKVLKSPPGKFWTFGPKLAFQAIKASAEGWASIPGKAKVLGTKALEMTGLLGEQIADIQSRDVTMDSWGNVITHTNPDGTKRRKGAPPLFWQPDVPKGEITPRIMDPRTDRATLASGEVRPKYHVAESLGDGKYRALSKEYYGSFEEAMQVIREQKAMVDTPTIGGIAEGGPLPPFPPNTELADEIGRADARRLDPRGPLRRREHGAYRHMDFERWSAMAGAPPGYAEGEIPHTPTSDLTPDVQYQTVRDILGHTGYVPKAFRQAQADRLREATDPFGFGQYPAMPQGLPRTPTSGVNPGNTEMQIRSIVTDLKAAHKEHKAELRKGGRKTSRRLQGLEEQIRLYENDLKRWQR